MSKVSLRYGERVLTEMGQKIFLLGGSRDSRPQSSFLLIDARDKRQGVCKALGTSRSHISYSHDYHLIFTFAPLHSPAGILLKITYTKASKSLGKNVLRC